MAELITLRDRRRARVLRYNDLGGALGGIDYVEVFPSGPDYWVILVTGLAEWDEDLLPSNFRITGSNRLRTIGVSEVVRLDNFPPAGTPYVAYDHIMYRKGNVADNTKVFVVLTAGYADGPHTLSIVTAGTSTPALGFDPVLYAISFGFSDAMSASATEVALAAPGEEPDDTQSPDLDYLSKDFGSFRQLMLDRLATTLSGWDEPSVVDLGHTLVDLLAYVADYLSYHQDAAATEAYLHTARLRPSVRRHARLLDYRMHDGNNARVWVVLTVQDNVPIAAGTPFLSSVPNAGVWIDDADYDEALVHAPVVFEAMLAFTAHAAWNEGWFYDWAGATATIEEGATSATLRLQGASDHEPAAGQVWILEQVRSPENGRTEDADPEKRHAIRLLSAERVADPLAAGFDLWQVTWHRHDALPFTVDLGPSDAPRYVLRGNVLLADHGRTRSSESLIPALASKARYRPRLPEAGLTQAQAYDAADAAIGSASTALLQDPTRATPQVRLEDAYGNVWLPLPDLLGSDAHAPAFVAEVSADGNARLRFGDDDHGAAPAEGRTLVATWRQGTGPDGNIGAGGLQHYVATTELSGVTAVRNPLPAVGGTDMESIDDVRRFAPYTFGDTHRAVTIADYVTALEARDDVQAAVATKRWTGSWWILSITVDRAGSEEPDAAYLDELATYLEGRRMMAAEVELSGPTWVGLVITITIELEDGYALPDVLQDLRLAFSATHNADGTTGFFHPDAHTFEGTIYTSALIARAMSVQGVARASMPDADNLMRWDTEDDGAALTASGAEIFRCDNDWERPENGSVSFLLEESS